MRRSIVLAHQRNKFKVNFISLIDLHGLKFFNSFFFFNQGSTARAGMIKAIFFSNLVFIFLLNFWLQSGQV